MEQDQVASTNTSRTDLVSVGSFASAQRDASSVTTRTSKPAVVATPAISSCGPDRTRKQGHYTVGYEYPGSVIGHRYCNPCNIGLLYPVPRNMGWLWNSMDVSGIKPRRGYTPGYIGKNTLTGSSAVVKLPHSFDKALAMKKRQKQQQICKVEVSTLLSDPMSTGTAYTIKMSHVDKKRENIIGEILHIPPADQNTILGSDAVYEAFQGIQDAEFMQYIENKKQKLKIALKRERRSVFEETIQDICKFVYDDMFPASQDKSCAAKDRVILSKINKIQSNDFTIKKLITEKQKKRFNSMLSSKHKPMNETFKKVNPLRESSERPIYPKTTNPSTQIAVKRDYIVERKPIVNQSMNKMILNTKHKQTPQSKMISKPKKIQFHKQNL